jgi:hypothetical protein
MKVPRDGHPNSDFNHPAAGYLGYIFSDVSVGKWNRHTAVNNHDSDYGWCYYGHSRMH